jgi:hypothetical protein
MKENQQKETEGRKGRENYDKSGKLAKRRELRRLEAIERAVRRVQTFETALEKAKNKGPAQADLNHAQYTLQTIRGGTDQHKLAKQFGVKAAPLGKAV